MFRNDGPDKDVLNKRLWVSLWQGLLVLLVKIAEFHRKVRPSG